MGDLKQIVNALKAISDEGRLRIVMLLHFKQDLCVCEIKEIIGLSQPTISSHLKQLQGAGILESSKDGLWVNYRLAKDMDENIKNIIGQIYDSIGKDRELQRDLKRISEINRHSICKG